MTAQLEAPVRERVPSIDAVRGFAVVCMVVDHLCVVFGGPPLLRLTVGRLAMPLFFVTAGRVSGRLSWRHGAAAAAGLVLPLVVPWLDSPNVLVWWALGAVLLAACRAAGWSPGLVVVAALGIAANGWLDAPGSSYPPGALWGLMAVGALLPFGWWGWGDRLPAQLVLRWCGRHALGFYVVHVLLLTAVGVAL